MVLSSYFEIRFKLDILVHPTKYSTIIVLVFKKIIHAEITKKIYHDHDIPIL